jgi:hypothetical protein
MNEHYTPRKDWADAAAKRLLEILAVRTGLGFGRLPAKTTIAKIIREELAAKPEEPKTTTTNTHHEQDQS